MFDDMNSFLIFIRPHSENDIRSNLLLIPLDSCFIHPSLNSFSILGEPRNSGQQSSENPLISGHF